MAVSSAIESVDNDDLRAYRMSAVQLHELWCYEQVLQSLLFGMELRTCHSEPSTTWGKEWEMSGDDFRCLKSEIRNMYVVASGNFTSRKVPGYGYGLFVLPKSESSGSMPFNNVKRCSLGYLVKAPSVGQCPTAHRYLRSPGGEDLYLGGPISLSNHDAVGNIEVSFTSGQAMHNNTLRSYHHVRVLRKSKPLIKGKEVTWNYYGGKDRGSVYQRSTWFDETCCAEKIFNASDVVPSMRLLSSHSSVGRGNTVTENVQSGPVKKRKIAQPAVLKQSVRLCNYCGVNLEGRQKGKKALLSTKNQLHTAMEHARDVALDMQGSCKNANRADFIKYVHAVSMVKNKLKSRGFHVIPATNYWKANNIQPLDENAYENARNGLFEEFWEHACLQFSTNGIIYLRGLKVPDSYSSLLPTERYTNYNYIEWINHERPSNRDFTLSNAGCTAQDITEHSHAVDKFLKDIVLAYTAYNADDAL